jgi:hypothetical protein
VLQTVGHPDVCFVVLNVPRYPNSPGSPAAVAELLARFWELFGHAFWPDDVSLFDREHVNAARLLDSAHVTDLALARMQPVGPLWFASKRAKGTESIRDVRRMPCRSRLDENHSSLLSLKECPLIFH